MIFGFDEHKGKVDVGAMLTQLQTNFQNNVNTLYNAFVAKGVTPAAKTVSAIVTAVTTLYNKGVTDAQAVTWVKQNGRLELVSNTIPSTSAQYYSHISLDCKNMVSLKAQVYSVLGGVPASGYIDFFKYDVSEYQALQLISRVNLTTNMSNIPIPNNAVTAIININTTDIPQSAVGRSVQSRVNYEATYQAKVLR